MVDVVAHPTNPRPELNYVLPRRSTAWVPTNTIEQGLVRLRALDRTPRFHYVEGLFPPQFGETLKKIHLQAAQSLPVLAFKLGGLVGTTAARPLAPTRADLRIRRVSAERGARLWANVGSGWKMLLAGLMADDSQPAQLTIDLAAYVERIPAGVLRVEIQPQAGTARLVGLALADGADDALVRILLGAGVRVSLRHGGRVAFALPDTPALAASLESLGFIELGRLVICTTAAALEHTDDRMAQPLLAER